MLPIRDVFFHRSGMETAQRCPRLGYLEYNYLGVGITKDPRAVWFDTGIAVHYGLGELMEGKTAEEAVERALYYYDNESQQTEEKLGFRWWEQRMLIEGLLWAFVYYALPNFMESYEVLYIEREVVRKRQVEFEWNETHNRIVTIHDVARPDVIVRDRTTGEIAIVNWKTINDLTDERKENHAKGMQSFREHFFGEHYLTHLRESLERDLERIGTQAGSMSMAQIRKQIDEVQKVIQLADKLGDEPQIDYTQFIYLVKGRRVREEALQHPDSLSDDSYVEMSFDSGDGKAFKQWRQDSPLVYPWVRQLGDEVPEVSQSGKDGKKADYLPRISYAWRYQKPGEKTFNTLGKAHYKREVIGLRGLRSQEWVKMLAEQQVFPSTIRPDLPNPLAKIVIWDNPVYRKPEMMGSLHRQLETQQVEYVSKLIQIESMRGEELKREVEVLFPQFLHSCQVPLRCEMYPFCHENKPLEYDGLPEGYAWRVSHHHAEREAIEKWQKGNGEMEPVLVERVVEQVEAEEVVTGPSELMKAIMEVPVMLHGVTFPDVIEDLDDECEAYENAMEEYGD
jgi:hypothetical protein